MSLLLPHIHNLRGIRENAYAQVDHAPSQSAEAKFRGNLWANRALFRLAEDAPFLFEETELIIVAEPDVVPTLATDLLSTTTDAWVLETDLVSGTADAVVWESNRKWAGRVIAIQDPSDSNVYHTHRIREVTLDGVSLKHKIVLDRPWPNVTDTGLSWRVATSEMVIPEDVIELRSTKLRHDGYDYVLDVMGQEAAERANVSSALGNTVQGPPRWVFKREAQSLRAPVFVPTVTLNGQIAWLGPEPAGEFEYCFTYIWGTQEDRMHRPGPLTQASVIGSTERHMPYWESPPSQISNAVVGDGAGVLEVKLPNYDRMAGFDDAGTERFHLAGFKKRIYRRRKSDTSGTIGCDDRFYLIAEVDGHVTLFTDDGTRVPDLATQLRSIQRYQTLGFYPKPDKRYEMRLRCVLRPPPLVDDQDAPAVPPDAIDALISRMLMYLYEAEGNSSMMAVARANYDEALATMRKRHGGLRSAARPTMRRKARVRRGGLHPRLRMPLVVDNA